MFRDLVLANRSYRRFAQSEVIPESVLRELVDLARCTPSAANLQPLRYVLSCTPERNDLVFSTLSWAGYLPDWPGPAEGERPSAYIIILTDTEISKTGGCDHGIAAQTICLGAVEKGYGCCMFGSIDRDALRSHLQIPDRYHILLVIAIGKPIEKVVLEEVGPDGSIKYYRDADQVHHVPKRRLEDVILNL
ncbi:MAG: nitroreductase family protein [Armatimonadota bacterium]